MSLLAPSPPLRLQFFYPGSSNPLSGGQVISVQPGTFAVYNQAPFYPMITYQDALGVTQNVNPGVLDGSGSISMFLTGPTDLYVFDPNSNLVVTQKNVSAAPAVTASNPQWILQSTVVSYISSTSFSVPGNQTAFYTRGTRVLSNISAGSIYGTISASSSGGTPIVTTVTVIWDSTTLNNTVTSVALGINIGGMPSALPVQPTLTSAATVYGPTIANLNQTVLFTNSPVTLNIPAGNIFPPGGSFTIKNCVSPNLNVVGTVTIDSTPAASPIAVPGYSSKQLVSDGTQFWSIGEPWLVPSLASAATIYAPTLLNLYQTIILTAGSCTVNVPAANTFPAGGNFKLKAAGSAVTPNIVGAVTIDGTVAGTPINMGAYTFKTLMSDATQWWSV